MYRALECGERRVGLKSECSESQTRFIPAGQIQHAILS